MFVYTTQVFGMLDEFAFGIFLARLVLDHMDRDADPAAPRLPRLLTNGWLWLAGFLGVGWATWEVYWATGNFWVTWEMILFWRTGAALAFFFLVGAAVFLRFPHWVERFLMPPFHYLGEISYGLYLWHLPVILLLKQAGITDPVRFLVLSLVLVTLLASLSWHFLERPVIRRFR